MALEEWDEIHGFATPGELRRFQAWIDGALVQPILRDIPVAVRDSASSTLDARWFERSDGTVWRLVAPDPPFTGVFEQVVAARGRGAVTARLEVMGSRRMSVPGSRFASPRPFRVWDYGVSHGQLVLRSPGEDEGGPHLDLHFSGVEYIRLPTHLTGVTLVAPGAAELDEVAGVLPDSRRQGRETFVLVSASGRFVVVAAELRVTETEGPRMITAIVHAERDPGTDLP